MRLHIATIVVAYTLTAAAYNVANQIERLPDISADYDLFRTVPSNLDKVVCGKYVLLKGTSDPADCWRCGHVYSGIENAVIEFSNNILVSGNSCFSNKCHVYTDRRTIKKFTKGTHSDTNECVLCIKRDPPAVLSRRIRNKPSQTPKNRNNLRGDFDAAGYDDSTVDLDRTDDVDSAAETEHPEEEETEENETTEEEDEDEEEEDEDDEDEEEEDTQDYEPTEYQLQTDDIEPIETKAQNDEVDASEEVEPSDEVNSIENIDFTEGVEQTEEVDSNDDGTEDVDDSALPDESVVADSELPVPPSPTRSGSPNRSTPSTPVIISPTGPKSPNRSTPSTPVIISPTSPKSPNRSTPSTPVIISPTGPKSPNRSTPSTPVIVSPTSLRSRVVSNPESGVNLEISTNRAEPSVDISEKIIVPKSDLVQIPEDTTYCGLMWTNSFVQAEDLSSKSPDRNVSESVLTVPSVILNFDPQVDNSAGFEQLDFMSDTPISMVSTHVGTAFKYATPVSFAFIGLDANGGETDARTEFTIPSHYTGPPYLVKFDSQFANIHGMRITATFPSRLIGRVSQAAFSIKNLSFESNSTLPNVDA